ncbi:hypothetical protein H8B09_16745 [Paenibacillus sp. PR3]|uniref:Uncharacterized protein n=1 Tax=Paenibacillus terricola TaxID=2763503 RepID=A0ABR8MWS8_9BACL|nr:hypothetical protein [Paenibacillus terricola]
MAKAPDQIRLLDIYQALMNNALSTKQTEPDYTTQVLSRILSETEKEFTKVLSKYTLDELYER